MAVSFIGGGNRSIRENTADLALTNFISGIRTNNVSGDRH
jgi:hypothetical protein